MSNRTLRVNELIQREISAYLHTRYQGEAVRITITSVVVAPDFRDARVFYSVIGEKKAQEDSDRWLQEKTGEIRHVIGKTVILKNVPKLAFVLDTTPERGTRVIQLLSEIEAKEHPAPET